MAIANVPYACSGSPTMSCPSGSPSCLNGVWQCTACGGGGTGTGTGGPGTAPTGPCPVGSYDNGITAGALTVCTPCPAGKVCAGGSAQPAACASGSVPNSNGGAAACISPATSCSGTGVLTNGVCVYSTASPGTGCTGTPSAALVSFCAAAPAGTGAGAYLKGISCNGNNQWACTAALTVPAGTCYSVSASALAATYPVCGYLCANSKSCKNGDGPFTCSGDGTGCQAGGGTGGTGGTPAGPAACAAGSTWSASGTAPCAACTACAASDSKVTASACTATADAVCACAAGYVFNAAGTACQLTSVVAVPYAISSPALCSAQNAVASVLSASSGVALGLRASFASTLGVSPASAYVVAVTACGGVTTPVSLTDPVNTAAVPAAAAGRRLQAAAVNTTALSLIVNGQTLVLTLGFSIPATVAPAMTAFLSASLSGASAATLAQLASAVSSAIQTSGAAASPGLSSLVAGVASTNPSTASTAAANFRTAFNSVPVAAAAPLAAATGVSVATLNITATTVRSVPGAIAAYANPVAQAPPPPTAASGGSGSSSGSGSGALGALAVLVLPVCCAAAWFYKKGEDEKKKKKELTGKELAPVVPDAAGAVSVQSPLQDDGALKLRSVAVAFEPTAAGAKSGV